MRLLSGGRQGCYVNHLILNIKYSSCASGIVCGLEPIYYPIYYPNLDKKQSVLIDYQFL